MAGENYNETGDLRAIRGGIEALVAAGGSSGGPATIADGADVTQGAIADAAYASGSGTVVSILKGVFGRLILPASLGAKAAASSLAVTQSTEDAALFGALTETAPTTDTASSGLNGRLQRLAQRVTSLIALLPTALGAAAASASLAVTSSTEDVARVGSVTETAPATDTASSGLNGRLQRVAQRLTSLIALLPTALGSAAQAASLSVAQSTEEIARQGIITETAPATDTASSGLNGRLQRIAQRITSLIALVPTALGSSAAASSFAVTASTEDVARVGIVTETAPATDTASSGLNGRLQRVAQRLTSLIALLPTALGSAAAAASLAVTQSTEDVARQGIITETAPATDTASSGQNGRLQRIAQRLTSLIALLPSSLGVKAPGASLSVVAAGLEYETVAASATAQVMGGAGGTGDYLAFVNVQPTSTAPGVVTILDNATAVHSYPGGTVGADLKPFTIPIYAASVSGPWKITTGANVTCTAFGDFAA